MNLPKDLPAAAAASRKRYESTGDLAALDEAIRLGRLALAQLAGAGAREGSAALELSVSLAMFFSCTGQLRHLDEALAQLAAAERCLPAGHLDLSSVYMSTAAARLQRYAVRGLPQDLDAAVVAGRRGVAAGPVGHPSLATRYANLTGVLRTVYQVTGNPAYLDESISQGQTGVQNLHPDCPSRSMVFATLASSLQARFARTPTEAHLAEAVRYSRLAVAEAPPGDVQHLTATAVLASALRLDFEFSGRTGSLTEAIWLQRETVSLLPAEHPEYVVHLFNLAAALRLRFIRLGVRPDLDAAIEIVRRALRHRYPLEHAQCLALYSQLLWERSDLFAAADDQDSAVKAAAQAAEAAEQALATVGSGRARPDLLIPLGNAWSTMFRRTGKPADRARAVDAYKQALAELPDGSPQIPPCQIDLGVLHMLDAAGSQPPAEQVRKAIGLFRSVLSTTDPGGHVWAQALVNLYASLLLHGGAAERTADVADSLKLYERLADGPSAPTRLRVLAGMLAGALLMSTRERRRAASAYADAVRLLPTMAWHGIDRTSQEAQLADISGLASDAAASQLSVGAVDKAVEILDQGRSVLWAQMLDLRLDHDALWREHPDLATRLRDLAGALDASPDTAAARTDTSRMIDRRMELASERDELLAQIRRLTGFEDFKKPPRIESLLPAAANGPVIVVNVSQWRCDALIVTTAGTQVKELPGLTSAQVVQHASSYLQALEEVEQAADNFDLARRQRNGGDRATDEAADYATALQTLTVALRDRDKTLHAILEWLWDEIAEPVLTVLGLTGAPAPGQQWTRLWWCPTGMLTVLPLHAAGHHRADGDTPRRTVLDRAVSSYTPTLRALADAQIPAGPEAADARLLVVAMPDTPGQTSLPNVARERDRLARLFAGRHTLLEGPTATWGTVSSQLPLHRWAHFSCHGSQNLTDPSRGGLHLHDRILTIADIGASRCRGEFAFLSACKTATGGAALADEAITLAAALHYTGYQHVIGALWSIGDATAAEVASTVYANLTSTGSFKPGRTAYALNAAVRKLRDSGKRLSEWTPFTHTGP